MFGPFGLPFALLGTSSSRPTKRAVTPSRESTGGKNAKTGNAAAESAIPILRCRDGRHLGTLDMKRDEKWVGHPTLDIRHESIELGNGT